MKKIKYCIISIGILFLTECNRYEGHNGYYFFWDYFDRTNLPEKDLNKDGEVTAIELHNSRLIWAKSNNLTIFNDELYSSDGKRISSIDAIKMADLEED